MTYNDDLYHWGIKGMKWGVRRYQNKDGTLTPAGRKRYDNKVTKLKSDKVKPKAEVTKKSIKDFSDAELTAIVTRMRLEQSYAQLAPKQEVSKGKKFLDGMWDKAIEPAIQTVAKDVAIKILNKVVNSVIESSNGDGS